MRVVIGVNPNRTVRKAANRGVSKYAQVQSNGKFKWLVGNPTQAPIGTTEFDSVGAAQQALGKRARKLKGDPTADVVLFPITGTAGVALGAMLNGH